VNTYEGLHASHYDLIYGSKPYRQEAEFVAGLLGRRSGTLLDLACGTGRHAVEFAAMGFAVTGVDYGEELLVRARENAAAADAEIDFQLADMTDLELAREFDAVTCLFDSIGYPCTDEGVIAALAAAARHLNEDGGFVAEFLHTPAVLAGASPLRVARWPTPPGGQLLRVSETELDREAGVMQVDYELIELHPEGEGYEHAVHTQHNRFFTVDEMKGLMSQAGLAPERFVAAYAEDPAVGAETWHVMALARRATR
jgi:SAM-dependent methyltransferase